MNDGASADGGLRYRHAPGPPVAGCGEAEPPRATLIDGASGETLFDGTAFGASRIVAQEDGSLLLAMEQHDRHSLFRIDPVARDFRDLSGNEPARPLGALAAAAAAADAESLDPAFAYVARRIAPDGAMLVELEAVEWSNSHWVNAPRVIEVATGRVLLDLWGSDWDAFPTFPRPRALRMHLRRYHAGGALDAEIDLDRGVYRVFLLSGETSEGPLAEMAKALEAASRRSVAATGVEKVMVAVTPTSRVARTMLLALAILAGAALMVAAMVWVTEWLNPEPAQELTPLPKPPPQVERAPSKSV